MFIKKHFFNYKISKNSVQIGKFLLKGFDEAFSDGVLLVEKKDNFYNFYLPTLESNDTPFRGNVLCIFSHIEEYVYENGLLFIKEKINNNKFIFNVIEPNQFSWYLNEKNLQKRKESLPKIPCSKNSEITFLNFEFFHGIFIKIDEINYFIDNSSRLSIKRIKGNICPSKIFNTVIVSNKFGDAFFENGKFDSHYNGKITPFKYRCYPYIDSNHYTGYFYYDSRNLIRALRIGSDIPNSTEFDYSYKVNFEQPLKKAHFVKRNIESYASNGIFPKSAIDIWIIETWDGETKYLIQRIGEKSFSTIIDKEDFNY